MCSFKQNWPVADDSHFIFSSLKLALLDCICIRNVVSIGAQICKLTLNCKLSFSNVVSRLWETLKDLWVNFSCFRTSDPPDLTCWSPFSLFYWRRGSKEKWGGCPGCRVPGPELTRPYARPRHLALVLNHLLLSFGSTCVWARPRESMSHSASCVDFWSYAL